MEKPTVVLFHKLARPYIKRFLDTEQAGEMEEGIYLATIRVDATDRFFRFVVLYEGQEIEVSLPYECVLGFYKGKNTEHLLGFAKPCADNARKEFQSDAVKKP
jgi:hypothetical protein